MHVIEATPQDRKCRSKFVTIMPPRGPICNKLESSAKDSLYTLIIKRIKTETYFVYLRTLNVLFTAFVTKVKNKLIIIRATSRRRLIKIQMRFGRCV